MGLEVAQEVVPSTVCLSAECTSKRPDSLVGLGNVTLEAVELGEGLSTGRPVLHDPKADLLFFRGNVLALFLGHLRRRRGLVT